MTPDTHDSSQWDRVAAELRACRETQQRAWGDIDNTTLGRFLAGEVTSEEQQQIENALDTLPELRKLTDLVRDVLGEADTAVPEPVSVPYGPMVLPFPQTQQRTMRPARTSPRAEPTAPSRQRKPWYREDRWRQRIGLAAAACLLLVLGVTLPHQRAGSVSDGQSVAYASGSLVADSTPPFEAPEVFMPRAKGAKNAVLFQKDADRSEPLQEKRVLLAHMDASLKHLEAQGKKQEADRLASQYAHNLTRQGLLYQRKGDLTHAEPALQEACRLCTQSFGSEAPQTVRTRNSLAGVYEVALNTASVSTYSNRANENPLPRSASEDKKSVLPGRPDTLRLMAMRPPASSSTPIHSASGYATPATAPPPLAVTDNSRRGYKPMYGGATRSVGYASSSQPSAIALRMRITHRSPKEVKASIVPVLTQAFREAKDAEERQRFASALGQLGPVARDAAPLLLVSCCRATDAAERATLLLVLARIGPTELRQTLEPYLRHKDFEGGMQASRRFLANSGAEPRP